MSIETRPTFVTNPKPLIVWEDVKDTSFYKVKLTKEQTPEEIIWETEKKRLELLYKESELLQFRYKDYHELSPLEEEISYLIVSEAYCSHGQLKARTQGNFFLIEKPTRDSFDSLVNLLREKDKNDETRIMFADFANRFFMNNRLLPNNPENFWDFFGYSCSTLSPWEHISF